MHLMHNLPYSFEYFYKFIQIPFFDRIEFCILFLFSPIYESFLHISAHQSYNMNT